MKRRIYLLLVLIIVGHAIFLGLTSSYAITVDEFNALSERDKKVFLEHALKDYLTKTNHLNANYNVMWYRCKFRDDVIISRERPFAKHQYEFRKIDRSYWFHHLWFPIKEGSHIRIKPDSEGFQAFDAKNGVARTLSTASHLNENEWYAYIMNDVAPACKRSVLPEFFDLSCRCESWTSMGYTLDNRASWKFLVSEKKDLIVLEMDDFHCELPVSDSRGSRKIWLDPAKGFVIVKENRDMTVMDEKWWSRKVVEEFSFVDDVWIPRKILDYKHFPDSFTEGSVVELVLENAHIGRVRSIDLTIEFPRGTKVFDKIRGIEYFEGDILSGDPTTKYYAVRYFLMIAGIVLIVLAGWRKMVEIRQAKGK